MKRLFPFPYLLSELKKICCVSELNSKPHLKVISQLFKKELSDTVNVFGCSAILLMLHCGSVRNPNTYKVNFKSFCCPDKKSQGHKQDHINLWIHTAVIGCLYGCIKLLEKGLTNSLYCWWLLSRAPQQCF